MLYSAACRALARVWPSAWVWRGGRSKPGLLPVCCFWSKPWELQAPAPLHLLARLLLWPFKLADWLIRLPLALYRTLGGIWRLPDFTLPWPPLP